ncbi:MAG: M1 family metallopeptidase [Kofleriaceae bacterium]|nr:MAG: M1 family metallopeptidase [Kofleriaceae bacterium]
MQRHSVVVVASWFAFSCGGPTPAPLPRASVLPLPAAVAAPPATALRDPTPPAFRLPGDVRPIRAELELTILPDQEHLDGIARFELDIVNATPAVWLHGADLTQLSATIGGQLARVVAGDDDVIGVVPSAPLAAGSSTLEIRYRAPIDRERSRGVYSSKEGADWYAYTMFEAIDARRAFPCFDEPGFKIPWQLTFHVRRDHVALANAPVVSEHEEAGGMKRVEIAESKPLPSYLVAFVVGPFELVEGGVAGRARTPVRFIVPRGRGAETRYAREATPRVVTLLEDYFDMPYPYEKLDVAVVPRYWGTMEHPGIVAMGQTLTLIPPDQETTSRKKAYANILIHELAHYWFGDVVTMAWWNDTWLNEALASWLDVKITDQFEPSWHYGDDGIAIANAAMNTDQLLAARAMRQPVDSSEAIQASFDNDTTYGKGAAVLRMFEEWIGPDRFQSFIRAYIRRHAWGTATADDFLAALTAVAGEEKATAFRTFLEHPGVPVIDMKLRCNGDTATLDLAQRRSLPAGVQDPSASTWHVPVCVRHGSRRHQQRQCWLLTTPEAVVALTGPCPTVIVPNAGGNGYYRSAVGERLGDSARRGAPRRERISAIDDAVAAWKHGQVDLVALLELALRLHDDPDERVALRATRVLWALAPDHLAEDHHRRYVRMIVKTFGARARKLGWQRRAGDGDDRHDMRRLLLAVVADHDPKLREGAARLTTAFLRDPTSVPDDIADIALSVAAARGDRTLFDQVLGKATSATDLRLRRRLSRTLGAFRDPALAAAARELLLAPELDLRESLHVLLAQLLDRRNRYDAWRWTRDHLPELLARMRDDESSWLIAALGETPCDRAHRDETSAWLTPLAEKIDGARNALAQSLERADRCIEIAERDLPAVRKFLARY